MSLVKNPKFDLRRSYRTVIELSFIVVLVLLILAFKYSPNAKPVKKIVELPPEVIKVEQIERTKHNNEQPRPEIPPIPIQTAGIDEPEDIIFDNIDIFTKQVHQLPPRDNLKDKIIEDEEPVPFHLLEQTPEPIGGIAAIMQKIKYPPLAQKIGLEGLVVIEVIIDESGNVIDAAVIKMLGGGCDEEALNAVKAAKFVPGKQRDKPVKVRMNIPVKFKLQ